MSLLITHAVLAFFALYLGNLRYQWLNKTLYDSAIELKNHHQIKMKEKCIEFQSRGSKEATRTPVRSEIILCYAHRNEIHRY